MVPQYQYLIDRPNRLIIEILRDHLDYSIEILSHTCAVNKKFHGDFMIQDGSVFYEMIKQIQSHIEDVRDLIFILSGHSFSFLSSLEENASKRHHMPQNKHQSDDLIWLAFIYVIYNNSLSDTVSEIKRLNLCEQALESNEIKRTVLATIQKIKLMTC